MPQPSENIEFFNFFVIYCFDRLYQRFPTPVALPARTWALNALESDDENSVNEADQSAMEAFLESAPHAIRWLKDEGFIRYEMTGASGDFFGVVLTSKALQALQKTPKTLDPGQTVATQIRDVVKGGVKKAGEAVVKKLIVLLLETVSQ